MAACQVLPSDPFGDFKWPFQGLSDLRLGYQKVTWKKLVVMFSFCPVKKTPTDQRRCVRLPEKGHHKKMASRFCRKPGKGSSGVVFFLPSLALCPKDLCCFCYISPSLNQLYKIMADFRGPRIGMKKRNQEWSHQPWPRLLACFYIKNGEKKMKRMGPKCWWSPIEQRSKPCWHSIILVRW